MSSRRCAPPAIRGDRRSLLRVEDREAYTDARKDDPVPRREAYDLPLFHAIRHDLVFPGGRDHDVGAVCVGYRTQRRLGSRRATPNRVHVRISLQRILNEPELLGDTSLAELDVEHLDLASFDGAPEANEIVLGPTGILRSGEGDNLSALVPKLLDH